jgi:hypothetical protein
LPLIRNFPPTKAARFDKKAVSEVAERRRFSMMVVTSACASQMEQVGMGLPEAENQEAVTISWMKKDSIPGLWGLLDITGWGETVEGG